MTDENKIIYLIDQTFVTEEYVNFLFSNQIECKKLVACEYLGLFCRMNDVVKITHFSDKSTTYVAPGDEYEPPYYYQLMYPGSTYPWRDKKGSLKHIYNEFEKIGVELSTTMYQDIQKNIKQKTYTK